MVIYLYIFFVALLWGGWPLVARATGNYGFFGAFALAVSATLIIGISCFFDKVTFPIAKDWGILAIAGAMMGLGLIIYMRVATNATVPISSSIPIINSAMIIVVAVGGALFFMEPVSLKKVIGVMMLVGGIVLLRPNQ